MAAIIGAILMLIVIILSILLIFGLPLGELTMGGRYKVFPKKLRIMLVSQLVTQVFLCIIILQTGGYLPLWFPFTGTRIICIAAAAYLSLNTVMNLISTSRKEKLIMTPLSLLGAICFWTTAL